MKCVRRSHCRQLFAFAAVALALVLFACKNSAASVAAHDDSSTDSATDSLFVASQTQTATYTAASEPTLLSVASDTLTFTITGLTSGQKLYLAKTNPTSTTVAKDYVRYVTKGSGITLYTASSQSRSALAAGSGATDASAVSATGATVSAANADEAGAGAEVGGVPLPAWHCYIPSDAYTAQTSAVARAATTSSGVTQISGTVGESRNIYIDTDSKLQTFKAFPATLRAVGTYCYVWIVDSYYSTTASGNKVNSAVAQSIATQFDTIYPMVRNVFGEESDLLCSSLYTPSNASYSMAEFSPTGAKVNIVLYDIAADYDEKTLSSTGIAGYFYSKDYVYNGTHSNNGKYFYIDSAYANSNVNDIHSTLAHEFQHMINFGVKNIEQNLSPGTAYNEMLSMLCEDMMADYFSTALDDFTEDATPINRLPYFNKLYYNSGLEYRSDTTDLALCSYATNYAFGAWLLRNYGGIPLLAAMSANGYVDVPSIVAAVQAVSSSSLTIAELLQAFATACIVNKSDYGFNRAVAAATANVSAANSYYYSATGVSYGYPLQAIDLWALAATLPELYADYANNGAYSAYYKFDGPALLASNQYAELRPYGMTLHLLGTATASSVTLTFSKLGASAVEMYVIIE